MQGRIIKQISNDYTVESGKNLYTCKCRGIFRKDKITPLVGDLVEFDETKKIIEKIYPRKSVLTRPSISNVEQAILVTSVKEPDFSTNLLDKLLVLISFHHVKPIIVLTKLDLLTEKEKKELKPIIEYYQTYYTVLLNTDLKSLEEVLTNSISVFTGQSGAGKSTLLNRLDPTLSLETNEISKALGRGKHTTRHTEFHSIFGGYIADTPGFSSIDMKELTKEDIKQAFPEFSIYQEDCKYQDCMHQKETECGVKEQVKKHVILQSRYENYLKFIGSDKK